MNTQLRKTRELYLAYIYILNPVIKLFLTKYYKNSTVYVLSYSYDSLLGAFETVVNPRWLVYLYPKTNKPLCEAVETPEVINWLLDCITLYFSALSHYRQGTM